MARPALQRLLADIAEDLVDVVVVYKVDRLTRALADFAKMVELFDTQRISTRNKGDGPKDLDNIMRDFIAPEFSNVLLAQVKNEWQPGGYIHGYRIYRVRSNAADDHAIRVKIMAKGTIRDFEDWTDKALEVARERLAWEDD
jgi:hypothetical protein